MFAKMHKCECCDVDFEYEIVFVGRLKFAKLNCPSCNALFIPVYNIINDFIYLEFIKMPFDSNDVVNSIA